MEMEWEIGYSNTGITDRFPIEFWPWEGDRVWMMGWWVVDCGHFREGVTPENYKTEIHPPFMTAFTRNESYVFPGETKPSSAVISYIYIHGRGGNRDTPVGGQDYEFDIPMPPKGNLGPQLQLRYSVISLPFAGEFGQPAPILTAKSGENKAHVVIPLSVGFAPSPDLRYGAIVAAKWVSTNGTQPSTEDFGTLRVTFDSIHINKDHDDGSAEWKNLWVGVNGKWIELSGPDGHYGLQDADDGETFAFPADSKTVTVIVPENGELKIKTTGWESDGGDGYYGTQLINCNAIPPHCEIPIGAVTDNNQIGLVEKTWTKAKNFGVGIGPPNPPPRQSQTSIPASAGDSETDRDFILNYHIEQLSPTGGGIIYVTVPEVECGNYSDAKQIIEHARLIATTNGPTTNTIVEHQSPQSGTTVMAGTEVILTMGHHLCQ